MFDFLKNMWIMNRIDEEYLKLRVDKKQITQDEYLQIIGIEKLSN
ncbi:MAG: hypothetical protein RR620_13310 [Clostridium sp.]